MYSFEARRQLIIVNQDNLNFSFRNPSVLDACDIDENVRELLLQDIRHRLMPQAVKLRADCEVSCFAYEGIDAIRAALKKGLELGTEELPIKVHLYCLHCI